MNLSSHHLPCWTCAGLLLLALGCGSAPEQADRDPQPSAPRASMPTVARSESGTPPRRPAESTEDPTTDSHDATSADRAETEQIPSLESDLAADGRATEASAAQGPEQSDITQDQVLGTPPPERDVIDPRERPTAGPGGFPQPGEFQQGDAAEGQPAAVPPEVQAEPVDREGLLDPRLQVPQPDAGVPVVGPDAGAGEGANGQFPPGLEPIGPEWRQANERFFRQVAFRFQELQRRRQPLPANHDEFVELLERHRIRLPDAPEGTRLVYDPTQGESGDLMIDRRPQAVERPADLEKEPPSEDDLVKAEAGVGARGHYESQNVLSTAISARFRAEERILFGQVNQAIQLFRAIHGRLPRSHEEFMTEVVTANGLRLPELPEGESYYYDPSRGPDGELMVRRPRED